MESNVIHINIEKHLLTANGNINLEINTSLEPGNLIALFGPSGAGKTTLLRILAGLMVPEKGYIAFGNETWYDSTRKINIPTQQRNISLMFQDYALFPNMSVEENLLYAQPLKDKKKVYELLDTFGLKEFRKYKTHHLSGGQKQRVALARALARMPKLLLLDEPLSALDANMRQTLQDEITNAHKISGTTTIMVSHDLSEVFRLAHHVVCIDNGKIMKQGKPEEVFLNNSISGKVQISGQIAKIEKDDIAYTVTVVFGNNQLLKVIAFENDMINLRLGDRVMVYTKAFNPIISKIS